MAIHSSGFGKARFSCYLLIMTDSYTDNDRMNAALEQLERALGRVESATAKLRKDANAAPHTNASDEELTDLKKRHKILRDAAEKAISQIDQITQ